jgi:hypothetical protein
VQGDPETLDDELLRRLVDIVGTDRFHAARGRQADTPVGQMCEEWFDVVWDILEAVCVPDVPDPTRAQAVVVLYEQAPSYTVLSQGLRIHQRYEDLAGDARLHLWARLRPHLTEGDERHADPVVYALWEEFFDDPMEEEVWDAIVGDRWPIEEPLLVRLLPRSGPVAPRFKYPLYERLLDSGPPGRWDELIYAGLIDAFRWYGLRIEDARVDAVLNRLRLPDQNAVAAYHDRVAQERERRRR